MSEHDTTTFIEAGFLSSSVEAAIPKFHLVFQPWVSLFRDLNAFGFTVLKILDVEDNQWRELWAKSCFYRILTSFESTLILVERGIDPEARTLLRSMVETLFVLRVTVVDPAYAKKIIMKDEESRRSLLGSAISIAARLKATGDPVFLNDEELSEMKNESKRLETERANNPDWIGSRECGVFEIAKKAGMEDFYKQHYKLLCFYAHPTPTGMADYILKDEQGKPTDFKIGPLDSDAEANMRMAIVVLIEAINQVRHLFSLRIDDTLRTFATRLDSVIDGSTNQRHAS